MLQINTSPKSVEIMAKLDIMKDSRNMKFEIMCFNLSFHVRLKRQKQEFTPNVHVAMYFRKL